MEFVLVVPLLILMVVGGVFTAFNFYQAQSVSEALSMSDGDVFALVNHPTDWSAGDLTGRLNAGSAGTGGMQLGQAIAQTAFAASNAYATVVVGTRNTQGVMNMVPGLAISSGVALPPNLLRAPSGPGSIARDLGTPWVPGGTPVSPPWAGGGAPPP